MSGFTHPRLAGGDIIKASGYSLQVDTKRGQIWNDMASHLRRRFVYLVHIDETQHLLKENATVDERRELANAIKGVSINKDWPVIFLLSGLPEVIEIPMDDTQFERRGNFVHFSPVVLPGERKLVLRILTDMAKPAKLSVEHLFETDLPERLAHAARYAFAWMCRITYAAIHEALRSKVPATALTLEHFAQAYVKRSHAGGFRDMNPFLVGDYKRLPQGTFLISRKPKKVSQKPGK